MANYATLKAAIQDVVKTNGNNEITGALLQQSLLTMINSLGAHYQFVDVATPLTNPGTPDQNVMYFAATAGTYSNFGSIVLDDGEACFLCYNGQWTKKVAGVATAEQLNELAEIVDTLGGDKTIFRVPEQEDSNISSNTARAGIAVAIRTFPQQRFNRVEFYVGINTEADYVFTVAKTSGTNFDNTLFQNGVLPANVISTKEIHLKQKTGYITIDFDNPIKTTGTGIIFYLQNKNGNSTCVPYYQNNTSGKIKTQGFLLSGVWYCYAGGSDSVAYGVMPRVYYISNFATKQYVDTEVENATSELTEQIQTVAGEIENIGVDTIVYKNDTQNIDNTVLSTGRLGFALYVPGVAGKKINAIDIPFSSSVECTLKIGQTNTTSYGNTLFQSAIQDVLITQDITINETKAYKRIVLQNPITPTKTGIVIFCSSKNNTNTVKVARKSSSTGMVQNAGYLDSNTYWYSLGGGALAESYSAMPILYLLSNVATKQYVNESLSGLDTKINDVKTDNLEIVLPNKIDAVVGDELQIFYRSILRQNDIRQRNILLTCTKGKQFPRFFDYTPVAGDVGTIPFNVKLRDGFLNTIIQKTCNLHIVGAGSSPSSPKKVVCIGDSLTVGGQWVTELSRRLTGTGGTPAGRGFNNIQFCGEHGSGNAKFFGVGGWVWSSYATAGHLSYRFFVSGVTSLSHNSVYSNNGSNWRIIEINVTDGVGNILCERYSGSTTPTASGTLTKVSGTGDETITFSSSSQAPANPFWDAANSKISFVDYANTYCGGTIDVLIAVLGVNGLSANQEDFETTKGYIHAFADALHTEFPNAKLKICGTACISFNGGAGANEGATGAGYADQMGIFYSMLNINKVFQEIANESAYNSFVEYVDIISQFDNEYNMQHNNFPVNTRNSQTEMRDTNELHPANSGYYQIADVIYRNFVSSFCQ